MRMSSAIGATEDIVSAQKRLMRSSTGGEQTLGASQIIEEPYMPKSYSTYDIKPS